MWNPEHRQAAERRSLRYPSDLTDTEWALVEPMNPRWKEVQSVPGHNNKLADLLVYPDFNLSQKAA